MISLPGDKLLLFGGWGGGADYLDDLWTYDLTANAWTKLSRRALRLHRELRRPRPMTRWAAS